MGVGLNCTYGYVYQSLVVWIIVCVVKGHYGRRLSYGIDVQN